MDEVVVVRSGRGERVPGPGVEHVLALTGEHTSGRLGVEEMTLAPATVGARPHVHGSHDETFVVLAGALTVATDGGRGPAEVVLGPGDVAHAPRGAVHGFRNADGVEPVRCLCLYTPPGYEQYFRDVHEALAAGAEVTDELLATLRARHDTRSAEGDRS